MSLIYTFTILYESFDNMDSSKICFKPDNNRLPLYTEIRRISDNISAIELRLDNQASQLSVLTEHNTSNQQDLNEASQRQNEAHSQAKQHVVGGLANNAPPTPGVSQAEVHESLTNHYSNTVEQDDLAKFVNNIPPTSDEYIRKRNRESASHYDTKQKPAVNSKSTGNSYVDKNKAKCTCPNNPSLGNEILKQADNYGFKKSIPRRCVKPANDCSQEKNKNKPRCTCTRIMASNYLKQYCIQAECEVVNPMGTYPSASKQISGAIGKASTSDHSKEIVLDKSDKNV